MHLITARRGMPEVVRAVMQFRKDTQHQIRFGLLNQAATERAAQLNAAQTGLSHLY